MCEMNKAVGLSRFLLLEMWLCLLHHGQGSTITRPISPPSVEEEELFPEVIASVVGKLEHDKILMRCQKSNVEHNFIGG